MIIDKPNNGVSGPGYVGDGYEAEFECAGDHTGKAFIVRTIEGWEHMPGNRSAAFPMTIGTRVAISDLDGTVTAWVDNGSGFTPVYSVQDSTFSGGYAGLEMRDNFQINESTGELFNGKGQKLTDFAYGQFTPGP